MGRSKNHGVWNVPVLTFNAFRATRAAELLLLSPGCHSYSWKRLSFNPRCSGCLLLNQLSSHGCSSGQEREYLHGGISCLQLANGSSFLFCVCLCFSLSLLPAWSLQRKAPSSESPSSHTHPCRRTHTLPFLSSPSVEAADTTLSKIYNSLGPGGF